MQYVENPPNPWLTHSVEWIGEPPEARLEVFEETETRHIITHNNSPDVDFDRKIIAKVNAPELLRKELMKPSWKGAEIVFSFTSDPYIPLEANYKLTRRCLEVCAEFRNPIGVITKSALIRRDIDILQQIARDASLGVFISIPFADYYTARAVEPFAPSPDA